MQVNGSPPREESAKIETDPASVQKMRAVDLNIQLELHRARGDPDVPKKSDVKLVDDKKAAILAALLRMKRPNLKPKGKAKTSK